MHRAPSGSWLEHERLGYNYRMTEMQAALGLSQLTRLETFLERRAAVAALYTKRLAGLDAVRPPVVLPHVRMSWFVYVVTLAPGLDRDPVMGRMEAQGIPTRGYFAPIHTQAYIRERFGDLRGALPVTESVAQRTVALPFHNALTEAQVVAVVAALTQSLSHP